MIGAYLFDINLNLIKNIPPSIILENTAAFELGGTITSTLSFAYSKEAEEAKYFGVKDNKNFYIYRIRSVSKEDGKLTFDGIHMFFDDLKGRVIRKNRIEYESASLAVEKILKDSGWHVGNNSTRGIASLEIENKSALAAFYEIIEKWDCEFKLNISFKDGKIYNKRIDLYDEISRNYGRSFVYGDKLISVTAESNTDDLYTGFIGIGKTLELTDANGKKIKNENKEKLKFNHEGKDYAELKEATKAYGYPDGSPKLGVIEFSDIEDANELYEATYKYTKENARPKVQFKAKGIAKDVELGEIVGIRRKDIGINYLTRVFKIKKDYLKGEVTDFEFGDKIVSSAAERIKAEDAKRKTQTRVFNEYLDDLRDEITETYFNDAAYNYDLKIGNKYNLPAGYYSFDKPIDKEPTKVVYMGAGKILIANSKKPDGSWDWRTALTADGVVADEVVGTLGKYAKISAAQINVNNDFFDSDLGKQFKILDGKIVDETGKVRNDLKLIDGKITTLDGKVVKQDVMYNNIKITQAKGLQVLDNYNRERVQLGNWAAGRYGLKLSDKSGNVTVLDDEGILQSWQDSQTDNVDRDYPLELHIYIPRETKSIYKASLNIYIDDFRAYQRGNTYEDRKYSTSESGGGDYTSTDSGGGDYGTTHGIEDVEGSHLRLAVFDPSDRNTIGRTESFWHTTRHEHKLSISDHRHRVDLPNHRHDFEIPGHTHDPIFGIITKRGSANYTILVNGRDITSSLTGSYSFSRAQNDLDISRYLSIGSWNTVSIGNSDLGRVSASIFIQALLGYGGY